MKKSLIIFLAVAMSMSSCSYYAYYQTGITSTTTTDPAAIKIYSGDIEQEYFVLGSVGADVFGDGEAVVKYLKKKASELGADAIIHTRLTKVNSFSQRTGVSGVAVKLK